MLAIGMLTKETCKNRSVAHHKRESTEKMDLEKYSYKGLVIMGISHKTKSIVIDPSTTMNQKSKVIKRAISEYLSSDRIIDLLMNKKYVLEDLRR